MQKRSVLYKVFAVVVYCVAIAMTLFRRDSVTGTPIVPKNLVCSRLRTEFEEIEFLGKGGFGDVVKVSIYETVYMLVIVVLQVRNHLDGKIYAIKRIELHKDNKQMYKKITREVRLLSNLNHENVVRYVSVLVNCTRISCVRTGTSIHGLKHTVTLEMT